MTTVGKIHIYVPYWGLGTDYPATLFFSGRHVYNFTSHVRKRA